MVGPNYKLPPAPVPAAFKEPPPEGWKEAQPNDTAVKGKWWEVYNDAKLNELEEQVVISNQNVLAAEAQARGLRPEAYAQEILDKEAGAHVAPRPRAAFESRAAALRRLEAYYARMDEKTKDVPGQEIEEILLEAIRSVRPGYEERH